MSFCLYMMKCFSCFFTHLLFLFSIVSRHNTEKQQFGWSHGRQNHTAKLWKTAVLDHKFLDLHTGERSVGLSARHPRSARNVHPAAPIRNGVLSHNWNHTYSTFSNAGAEEGCHGLTSCYPFQKTNIPTTEMDLQLFSLPRSCSVTVLYY